MDGEDLTLTYNTALDTESVPAASAFEVTVDGAIEDLVTLNPVSIVGSVVTLRLRVAVTAGQTVRVSYTAPAMNPLRSTGGASVGDLSNLKVINALTPVVTVQRRGAPFNQAATATEGRSLRFTIRASPSPAAVC